MTSSESQMYFVYGSTDIRVYRIREAWQQPRHGSRSRKLRFHTLTKSTKQWGQTGSGEARHSQSPPLPRNASPNEVAPRRPPETSSGTEGQVLQCLSYRGQFQSKPPHLDLHVWESALLTESLPNMHSHTFFSSVSSCLSLSRKKIKVG